MKALLVIACAMLILRGAFVLQASPLEDRLLALFQEKCADCHQGDEDPELSKDTRLSSLYADTKLVTPGNSKASRLVEVLLLPEGDKDRMPRSTKKDPLPPLSSEEIAIVRQWVDGDATQTSAPRTFISATAVDEFVLADLKKLKQTLGVRNNQTRYLSLANIYNERKANGQPLHSDEQIEHMRTGVNKLLNSLSWKPEIVNATPVDPARVILRIDLEAYGIPPDLWHRMAGGYPYLVERDSPAAKEARKIIGDLHVMRADYFAFITAQPPYYHLILGLPGGTKQRRSDVELETRLGVVYHRDVKTPETIRAGFQKSGVSQGNRLIERIHRPDGDYYWKSYDFDTARQNERGGDLFRSPLGPNDAGLTKNQPLIFSQDGGELIFSLPNGLQGYMLIDALGIRLDEAPIRVVTDKSRKDSRIINGISCIQCHQGGMFSNGVVDQMLATSANLKLDAQERAAMVRMHDQKKLEKAFAQDSARFMAAVAKCGPAGKDEPVGLLYFHYLNDLLPIQLNAELELEPSADLLAVLTRIQNPEVVNLTARLKSSTPLPRQDFEKTFPVLAASLGIGKVPPRERIAVIEFGGDLDRNSIGRDEAASGPIVKGASAPRPVLRIDMGGGGAQSPSVAPARVSVPSSPAERPVRRFDGNTSAPPSTSPVSVAPAVAPDPAALNRVQRRFDANGNLIPVSPVPASTPPTNSGAPSPTDPPPPAPPKPVPSSSPVPKPVKIDGEGKPAS